jgi:hypothetical protein
MTSIPYAFKKFLYKNTKYNKGTKYTKKDLIRAVILSFYDINPSDTLGIQRQNLSIMFKKAYGHLLDKKPSQVPIPKYLLFLSGYKRCKLNKEIYPLYIFELTDKTWDGYKNSTTQGRSEIYFRDKVKIQEYRQWYQQENSEIIANISAKRRAKQLNATPSWLSNDDIINISKLYKEAKAISLSTGMPHHVDHIVPLQGKNVCGLHVPWNLRVIPATDNLIKSNKFSQENYHHFQNI